MLVDANVLLRVFDGPDHTQHADAVAMIRDALEHGETLRVLPNTLIEMAFVLSSKPAGYGYERSVVAQALSAVLDDPSLLVDGEAVWRRALDLYVEYPVDLDDLYLAAVAEDAKDRVLSFDRDFDRLRRDGVRI